MARKLTDEEIALRSIKAKELIQQMSKNKETEQTKKAQKNDIKKRNMLIQQSTRIEKYIKNIKTDIEKFNSGNKSIKHFELKEIEHQNAINDRNVTYSNMVKKLDLLKNNNTLLDAHNNRARKAITIKQQKIDLKIEDIKNITDSITNESDINKKDELLIRLNLYIVQKNNLQEDLKDCQTKMDEKVEKIIDSNNNKIITLEKKMDTHMKKTNDMLLWVEGAKYNYVNKREKKLILEDKLVSYQKELNLIISNLDDVKSPKCETNICEVQVI